MESNENSMPAAMKESSRSDPDPAEARRAPAGAPALSVIVPVYNAEKYIVRCLESLQAQTFKDLEIICVDDGSTDGSLRLLSEYADARSGISIISQTNAGVSAARNAGLKAACGEWIGFVDSDDWVDAKYFGALIDAATSADADIAMAGICYVHPDKRVEAPVTLAATDTWKTTVLAVKISAMPNGSVCNKVIKRRLIEDHGIDFPAGRMWEDNLFLIKALYHSQRMVAVSGVFYYYDSQNSKSLTRERQAVSWRDRMAVANLVMDFAEEKRFDSQALQQLSVFVAGRGLCGSAYAAKSRQFLTSEMMSDLENLLTRFRFPLKSIELNVSGDTALY